MTYATRQLEPEEIAIIREHYVLGAKRHRYETRKRIIGKIIGALNSAQVT